MIYLCIYSPVCSVWFRLVYSLLPVYPVSQPCLDLPCLALMSSLKTIILSLSLVCVFLYPPCCVHRDRRPDLTVSGAPSPRFVLFVFSSFCFVPVFCLSRQASPLAASPHARRSREISATGCGYPKPSGWFSSSRVAATSGPPFAGDDAAVRGSPRPAVRGRSMPGLLFWV